VIDKSDEVGRAVMHESVELLPLSGDLRGAEQIAEFVYGSPRERRKIYHLVETSRLPVFRLGAALCARKSTLLTWIDAQEVAALTARKS
jgi:hypothetical protein